MKSLDTSHIASGVRKLGATKQTLDHIQNAYKEIFAALIAGITDTTGMTLINGCVNSGSGSNYVISAGAVYYNGEVFLVPAFTGTAPGGTVPVLNSVTSYIGTDPAKYSDGNDFNTHADVTMQFSFAASGTGLCDFSNLKQFGKNWVNSSRLAMKVVQSPDNVQLLTKVIQIGDWNMDANPECDVPHGLGANYKKIRSISVIIRDDGDSSYYDLTKMITQGTLTGASSGGIGVIDSTVIPLWRTPLTTYNGWFDGTGFDSTGYNRGWITIHYEA